MGNTNKKHKKRDNTNDNEAPLTTDEESFRNLPLEILVEIFVEMNPVQIITCRRLSTYWNKTLKENVAWRAMCQKYCVPTAHLPKNTDFFEAFLSRYAALFMSPKLCALIDEQTREARAIYPPEPIQVKSIPTHPKVDIGRFYAGWDLNIADSRYRYGLFKEQKNWHPNLVAIANALFDDDASMLFYEHIDGNLMAEFIKRPELLTESNICDIIIQVMGAIEWLNSRGIDCYRLNLQSIGVNFLPNNKLHAKLVGYIQDFTYGADVLWPRARVPEEIPPEVLKAEITTQATNMYRLGWLTYFLFAGCGPFDIGTDSDTVLFQRIMECDYNDIELSNTRVCPLAKAFISKLLVADPESRMTVEEAKKHEWILKQNKSTEPMVDIAEKYRIYFEANYQHHPNDVPKITADSLLAKYYLKEENSVVNQP